MAYPRAKHEISAPLRAMVGAGCAMTELNKMRVALCGPKAE